MTMLVCTVTRERCLLSQDNSVTISTAAYREHAAQNAGITESIQQATETAYVGGGGPKTVKTYGSACKIIPLPRLNMAMAGTGDFDFLLQWWCNLIRFKFQDILDLDRRAPDLLRDLASKCGNPTVAVVHAGWSRLAQCSIARVYSFDQGFRSVEIPIGKTLGAMPDPEDPEYPSIEALYAEVHNRSVGLERLHCALYRQMRRSYYAGRLAPGAMVGGGLVHCSVSGYGIEMKNAQIEEVEEPVIQTDTGEGDVAEMPLPDLTGLADVDDPAVGIR